MGADMQGWFRAKAAKDREKARQNQIARQNLAERGENAARIKRLEAHARQASAYAHQMAVQQQQRAAAEAARRRAAEEAAKKRAKQAAIDKRSKQFDAQREERKEKIATNNATNYWDQAQSIVQSSFGNSFRNSFGGGKDASKQSKYNVMGKDYDFSSVDGNQSATNSNVEVTGDNKPPDSQTFANNYKSKVLEDQKAKKANNSSSFS